MSLGDCYIIELDRWGIKNNGTLPIETTQGINNAFIWAGDNGFQTVVLPKGNYLVDKNSALTLRSNIHYKFHDCIFIKEANNLTGYIVIVCDSIKNVIIEGAIIKGDRETHDYSSGGTHEWGYGIAIENSCYNILIKDCDVSECTGDGFTTSMNFDAIGGVMYPNHFAKGDIDSQGKLDATKTNYTTVTKFFDVTGALVKSTGYFYYSGDGYGGYGIGCNLNKTIIKVHFYKADGSYLGYRNTRSYEFIYLNTLPRETTQVRFSFLQNFDLMKDNLHYISCAKIPQYVHFLNCKSHENRRLGMSVAGGRFVTFDSCEIFNNSNPMSNSTGVNPGYGIDIEDGYMANQKITIRDCNIYSNRGGAVVTVSSRGVYVENNKFGELFSFSGSGDDYLSVNNMYYGGFQGKSITGGEEADGTFCTFRNDSVFGSTCNIDAGNTTLENCAFSKSSISLNGETAKIINCKFTWDSPESIDSFVFGSKYVEIRDSSFDIRRSVRWVQAYNISDNVLLSNVKFITGESGGGTFVNARNLIMQNCEFIHNGTNVNYGAVVVYESMRVENSLFKNISFRFDGGGMMVSPEALAKDTGYITHSFRNNKVIWDVNYGTAIHEGRGPGVSFLYIPRLGIIGNDINVIDKGVALGSMYTLRVFAENHLTLSNNTIVTVNNSGNNTKGTITVDGAFRQGGSTLAKPKTIIISQNNNKVNSDITFTSNVNSQLEKNILGDIPLVSLVSEEPTFGTYALSQILYHSAPTPGGYVGWVCTTAGTASNTPWKAATVYNSGARIYNGTYVYEAQNGGRSTTTPPVFPIGVNTTVEDKVGTITWTSKAYMVGDLVIPSTPNGYYYECTKSGAAGVTQPIWTTTENSTIADGTVIWTVRRIITWKWIDTKAVFKKFGLISG
ncbi:right-handed parallel beta-helix repeat-containing protein [Bacillus sp. FJAT-53711]|uniref:Right-handed parallel beta-helix repeat-containing protein n=1 Tax=Bacillus yunxiaonensis TaxID=3127665 RepID=A0ABU8FSE0_9BACI